ncbi:hypothetical protein [Arthrobacter alpinus]|nr:hypothetical protein [Arthrobacter alpinus]
MSAADDIGVQGATSYLSVNTPMVGGPGSAKDIDTQTATALIQATAQAQHANIARMVPDLQNPATRRNLYLEVGDGSAASATWLAKGYPDFARSMTTTVLPWEKIASMDVRGRYVLFGANTADVEHALTVGLEAMGLDVTSTTASPGEVFQWFLATSGLGASFLILALIVVVSSGAGVILNARSYAIQRLQGSSFAEVLSRDLLALGRFALPLYVGVALLTAIGLFVYNSLHQLAQFGMVALLVAATLALTALLTHTAVLVLAGRVPLIAAVKGLIPSKSIFVSIYTVRIAASLLAVGILSATLALGGQVLGQQASKAVWASNSDLNQLQFASYLSMEEFAQQSATFAHVAKQADADGQAVLAFMRPFAEMRPYDPNSKVAPAPGPPVVFVNSSYLERETILDAQGQRIQPSNTVRLLVPETLQGELTEITAVIAGAIGADRPFTETVMIANNQAINAFGSNSGILADTEVPGAVLVTIPSGGGWITEPDYYAYAMSGAMLFTDPARIISGADTAGAPAFVTGFHPAALDASIVFQKDASALRNHLFSTIAAIAVLMVTSLGVAIIYTRKNAQRIFTSFIHGWRSWRVNKVLLTVEAVAGIGLVLYGLSIPARHAGALAKKIADGGAPVPVDIPALMEWAPAIAAGIALVSITFTLLALRGYKTSLIRSHSADA